MSRGKSGPDQNSLPEEAETVTEDTILPEQVSTDYPQPED